jgi:hypothetical protein
LDILRIHVKMYIVLLKRGAAVENTYK